MQRKLQSVCMKYLLHSRCLQSFQTFCMLVGFCALIKQYINTCWILILSLVPTAPCSCINHEGGSRVTFQEPPAHPGPISRGWLDKWFLSSAPCRSYANTALCHLCLYGRLMLLRRGFSKSVAKYNALATRLKCRKPINPQLEVGQSGNVNHSSPHIQ